MKRIPINKTKSFEEMFDLVKHDLSIKEWITIQYWKQFNKEKYLNFRKFITWGLTLTASIIYTKYPQKFKNNKIIK